MDRAAPLVTAATSLRNAPVGARVAVAGFGEGIPAVQLEQLMSYGVVEGRTIEVLAQRPVTVVLVEHTELALEAMVAQAILARTLER
jgi:Fe2+ transport system protein FeoA